KYNRAVMMDMCFISMPVDMNISESTKLQIAGLLEKEYEIKILEKNAEKMKEMRGMNRERISKGYPPDKANPQLYQYIKDYGEEMWKKYGNNCVPLLSVEIPESMVKRNWKGLASEEGNTERWFYKITQSIMERQDRGYYNVDFYRWAQSITNHVEVGNL